MRIGKFHRENRGQTLVIVALMIIPLLGFTGLVSDVAWYEVNLMRIQRAADAAALAGVVYLPGNVAGAQTAAQQEAAKNGFTNGTVGGRVWLYDPMFCATGAGTVSGRRLGAGDNWFSNGTIGITTVYNLLDMNGTPYTLADDTLIATSGALFANSNAVDKGPLYRGNQNYGGYNGSGSADCQSSPYHNNWYRLATGLGAGEYRLQVTTSSGTLSEDAINAFGIQASAAAGPLARVYGQSRMEAFIVINNTSVFYLAQIE